MLELTQDQADLISDPHDQRIVATSYYDGVRTWEGDLPVVAGTVDFDDDASVGKSAKLTLADPDGALVPTGYDSPLSPYGSRLYLEYEAKLGTAVARIPLGWFVIDDSAEVDESMTQYANGKWVHAGSFVTVPLIGLLSLVDNYGFEAPDQATAGDLVWNEIRRLAVGLQITVSINPNATVPATFTYPDNRLDALNKLAALLGGAICELVDGTISVRSDTPDPDAVWTINYGAQGRLVGAKRSLKVDKFANVFISKSTATEGDVIQARVAIEEGPLRAGGPMHYRIKEHASPLIDSYAMALADATTVRATFLKGQPSIVPLTCLPNPALQGMDTVAFDYYDRAETGVVKAWSLSHSGPMSLTLETPPGVSPWE